MNGHLDFPTSRHAELGSQARRPSIPASSTPHCRYSIEDEGDSQDLTTNPDDSSMFPVREGLVPSRARTGTSLSRTRMAILSRSCEIGLNSITQRSLRGRLDKTGVVLRGHALYLTIEVVGP